MKKTSFTIEFDQETDGRWIAAVLQLPGVLCYGESQEEAQAKAEALALRVVADQLEQGEKTADLASVEFSFVS
ncbi:MAG TPA: type II toxin-antitoxin system HicB family antitoxin [Negativicutes bacterium]|nr:type II toxin-antitoxin system HicB family antitoxin [Negativicutes bacterium]